jgi:hypothetical protein
VVVDPALLRELLAADGRDGFVALVVRRAVDAGWAVTADDVEDALRARRQEWRSRWL